MLAMGLVIGFGIHSLIQAEAEKTSIRTPATATPASPTASATPAPVALPLPPTVEPAPQPVAVQKQLPDSPPTAPAATIAPVPQPLVEPVPTPLASQVPADILDKRIEATKVWLTHQQPSTVSIQIMSANNLEKMRNQLESLAQMVELDNLYVYRTTVNGNPIMCVLYGSYPDRTTASRAMAELPKALRAYRPHLRTVSGIAEEIKVVQ
jgi:septal ring-binding cell division protein DamX